MKKICFTSFLALCLTLCLFGCSQTTADDDSKESDVSTSESIEDTSVKPSEKTVYKPSKMIERIKYEDRSEYSTTEYVYTYDSDGKLIKEESSSGETIEYTYDENGKLIKSFSEIDFLGEVIEKTTEYVYNNGLLTQKRYGEVTVKYTYDENNNCIKDEYYINGNNTAVQVTKYTYNTDHALIKEEMSAYGDVELIEYSYNEDGKIISALSTYNTAFGGVNTETSTYTYDKNGNLLKIQSASTSEGDGALVDCERIVEYLDYKSYNIAE